MPDPLVRDTTCGDGMCWAGPLGEVIDDLKAERDRMQAKLDQLHELLEEAVRSFQSLGFHAYADALRAARTVPMEDLLDV